MKKTNNNASVNTTAEAVRNTETIREELISVCEQYSVARIKHDQTIASGKSITKKMIDELGDLNSKCDDLVDEFKKVSRTEFHNRCANSKKPTNTFFAIYEYETLSVVDEPVSKENPEFARRSVVSKMQTPNIYNFEKEIGVEPDVIATQKGYVNKLGRNLTMEVASALGCGKAVETTIAPENKKAETLAFDKKKKGDRRSETLIALQNVVDSIYFELDKKTNANSIVCDETDEQYLGYCFTRKGKERLSVKVLRDGGLVFVITDMIHKAIVGANYTVTGYKVTK